ncbi:DUF2218 domain-containing protein [Flaviflagellibacter deserti]|uniref:DUF2218 domain-containing protein n=1 Tax=Flaviflagellibacter deserti TaxID=2267266 RepID=A0ABV9YWA6_9HYPH
MHRNQGIIATSKGSSYLQQLCKHWSHRLDVEFTPSPTTTSSAPSHRSSSRAGRSSSLRRRRSDPARATAGDRL